MVLALVFALLLVSCTSFELNNPNDPAKGAIYSSSSSLEQSSSSSSDTEELVFCKVYYLDVLITCERVKKSVCEDYDNTEYYKVEIAGEC
ncbi:MAG: hypothetical protein LBC85_09720 [Fibromonadaceae bacterium]|jgi:hypothetical protein|nr:hypothetical protein [Fibromonadaceae bacterium]